jgi:hypothetical protein
MAPFFLAEEIMQSKPFDELIGQLGRLESDDKPAPSKAQVNNLQVMQAMWPQNYETCAECHGTGKTCAECHGTGKTPRDKSGEPAPTERMPKCARCGRVALLCVCALKPGYFDKDGRNGPKGQ